MEITLEELKQQFKDFPTTQKEYEIDDRKYIVISHFVGDKNVNEILLGLAKKQAYNEIN